MERLSSIIGRLCRRPGIYIGRTDMRHVRAFLNGYLLALEEMGELKSHPWNGFAHWLELRHGIQGAAWGWDRILVHAAGSHAEAIRTLPAVFSLYRSEVESGSFDPDGLYSWTGGEPEQTCTDGYNDG